MEREPLSQGICASHNNKDITSEQDRYAPVLPVFIKLPFKKENGQEPLQPLLDSFIVTGC